MQQNFEWLNQLKDLDLTHARHGQYGEDIVIDFIISKIGVTNRFFIDIGAGAYGTGTMSNTRQLVEHGWNGLSFDMDAHGNGNDNIIQEFVTPFNIVSLLKKHNCPAEPDFINIDIDGHDYDVLDRVLSEYKPRLVCSEYNATLPVLSKIKLAYEEGYLWKETNKYGYSFGAGLYLFDKHGYSVVMNHVNSNLFALRNDLLPEDKIWLIAEPQQTLYHSLNNNAVWVHPDEEPMP